MIVKLSFDDHHRARGETEKPSRLFLGADAKRLRSLGQLACINETSLDIFGLQVGEVVQNFFCAQPLTQHPENLGNTDAKASNARLSSQLAGLLSDAFKQRHTAIILEKSQIDKFRNSAARVAGAVCPSQW